MSQLENFDVVIDSPVGRLGIWLAGICVSRIRFLDRRFALQPPADSAGRRVVAALEDYFVSAHSLPSIEVAARGTDFQQRVWRALRAIPPGQVVTYGALARRLRSSARAVGNACRHNPVPIVVPCHRVVAAAGPGGFAGDRDGRLVDIKLRLLAHEGIEIGVARPHLIPSQRKCPSEYQLRT
ncbi:MAG: methylated-DNA--[protein]-cysteine S-methyltransferase [Gammaproteobacteria bacterium]|jgi:methylated-DNA-[protein]-cysteine S-methyltransferase